jgi:hypothetical protein
MSNKFTNFYKQILNEISFDADSVQDDFDHFEFRKHNPLMFDRQGGVTEEPKDTNNVEVNTNRASDFTHQIFQLAKESDCEVFVHRFYDEIGRLAEYYADTTDYVDVVGVERQKEHESYYNSEDLPQGEDVECVVVRLNVSRDNQDIQQKIILTLNSLTDEKEIDIETE